MSEALARVSPRPITTADPYGLDRNGITKHVGSSIPPAPEETPVADKPCKLCARFAPEKCRRHGGAPKKAPKPRTGGGKRVRKSGQAVRKSERSEPAMPSRNGHDVNGAKTLLLEKLDEQIADTKSGAAGAGAAARVRGVTA